MALDEPDLVVHAGEVVCLPGANGAGQTTTLNLFLGFLEPSSGEALVAGPPVRDDPSAARAALGYVAEVVSPYGAAIAGQLAGALYGASGIPDEWLGRLAWRERIEELADRLFEQSLS